MRIPGPRRLTLAQQYHGLRVNPICRGQGSVRGGRLTWEYDVQPTPLSRTYAVRITYRLGEKPEILVRRPDLLALSGGRRLPHVYQQHPTLLCLYRPNRREWFPQMRIDQFIAPWTSVWFFYFEEWLDSNEWQGGGEHPDATGLDDSVSGNRKPRARP